MASSDGSRGIRRPRGRWTRALHDSQEGQLRLFGAPGAAPVEVGRKRVLAGCGTWLCTPSSVDRGGVVAGGGEPLPQTVIGLVDPLSSLWPARRRNPTLE